jgi:hypothetical protein
MRKNVLAENATSEQMPIEDKPFQNDVMKSDTGTGYIIRVFHYTLLI